MITSSDPSLSVVFSVYTTSYGPPDVALSEEVVQIDDLLSLVVGKVDEIMSAVGIVMECLDAVLIFSIPGAAALNTGSALPSFKNSSPLQHPSCFPSPLGVNFKLVCFLKVKNTLASNASCFATFAIFYLQIMS